MFLVGLALLLAGCSGVRAADSGIAISAATPQPSPTATPAPARTVTIAAVGDLMLARRVTTMMLAQGAGYPLERVRPLFEGADLVIANMEGTFTDRGTALEKEYTFRTPPRLAQILRTGGVGIVTLANNHAFDFGATGLEDTLAAIDDTGVARVGAGRDLAAAASATLVRTADGTRVAFLGFDDIPQVQFATASQPGVARAEPEAIATAVRAAGTRADFVVVFFHWGVEYSHEPTPRQHELARAAVEAGASAVLGAHPHVLQPWARMGAVPVLYSLGNFVFDLSPADVGFYGKAPFQSAVAVLTLSSAAPARVTFRPAIIDPIEDRPRPANGAEAAEILTLIDPGNVTASVR